MTTTKTAEGVFRWFSGKGLEGAVAAMNLLDRSREAGFWFPGSSRKVRSLFSKQNVAAKLARGTGISHYSHPLNFGISEMTYGAFQNARRTRARLDSLMLGDHDASIDPAPATMIAEWCDSWAEVADAVALLDSRRPVPTIVCKTLSPSVVANLARSLGLDLATVCVPPMEGRWVEVTRPIKGDRRTPPRTETVQVWHVEIKWPPGTRHMRSRFSCGSNAGNAQCEACGHAIRDPYNWVPLLAVERGADAPSSLWVGRDCARKLLGCEVGPGEAIYTGRAVAA